MANDEVRPVEDPSDAVWVYLFSELPFVVRHRWGGDWREFREGVLKGARRSMEGQ